MWVTLPFIRQTLMGSITYISLLQNRTITMVSQYMFHTPPGGKNWEVHTLGLRLFNEILNKDKYMICGLFFARHLIRKKIQIYIIFFCFWNLTCFFLPASSVIPRAGMAGFANRPHRQWPRAPATVLSYCKFTFGLPSALRSSLCCLWYQIMPAQCYTLSFICPSSF